MDQPRIHASSRDHLRSGPRIARDPLDPGARRAGPAPRAERCDHCGDCVRVCPEPQVLHFDRIAAAGFVGGGECTNCARCIEVCPQEVFSFNVRPIRAGDEPATTEI
ncbi:MAG: 4Fe-4S dicluster domain-containing protein [Deltaproteobacteria bacterium]|nr:4Fe-4S dicluster domain-containing protein [Deltaproteobacteria bacterium]